VTLPATLWFFDKAKTDDRILFIDARNVFTQVDRAHREFSDEQLQNIASPRFSCKTGSRTYDPRAVCGRLWKRSCTNTCQRVMTGRSSLRNATVFWI
jgi:hypothetical protein